MATKLVSEPSEYMRELTRYLSNIMNSVLLALPAEIKEFIYFDALSHAATAILNLTLDESVKRITPCAVAALAKDTAFLVSFVESLGNPILMGNLDELRQTVALMQTTDSDEFFDVAQRNRKYGNVDNLKGAMLIEKVAEGRAVAAQSPAPTASKSSERFAAFGSRFGIR